MNGEINVNRTRSTAHWEYGAIVLHETRTIWSTNSVRQGVWRVHGMGAKVPFSTHFWVFARVHEPWRVHEFTLVGWQKYTKRKQLYWDENATKHTHTLCATVTDLHRPSLIQQSCCAETWTCPCRGRLNTTEVPLLLKAHDVGDIGCNLLGNVAEN